ncbi:MAG: quinolinate synthase NadA [Clostridia bacterium]|nr:quinolinate synthase NadA [Clostridia bacterium]
MTVFEMQKEIERLKREKDVCILAHTYQSQAVTEIADFTGDSFALATQATKAPQKSVIMCGVRFMAETVKILSPEKKVYLSAPRAGCPMAEQLSVEEVLAEKKKYPDCAVVAYVNTTAELKAVCDVCVTSSSAVRIVKSLPQKEILFVPDCNLGAYVAEKCPEKTVHLMRGCCPVHAAVKREELLKAKALHPDAAVLVHPECKKEVIELADCVGSTKEIIDYAKASEKREFIVGTEISVCEHLSFDCPDKRFYQLSKGLICADMKLTSLSDVYHLLKCGGEEVELDGALVEKARKCIDKMLTYGK